MRLKVTLLNGTNLDFSTQETSVILGRSPKCQIVIPDEGISRQHCQIEYVDGDLYVTDLHSTNGVALDGMLIDPGVRTPYFTYFSFSFGTVQSLQITLDDAAQLKHTQKQKTTTLQRSLAKPSTEQAPPPRSKFITKAPSIDMVTERQREKDMLAEEVKLNAHSRKLVMVGGAILCVVVFFIVFFQMSDYDPLTEKGDHRVEKEFY